MGLDIDLFVHPERISPQLICPICTQVLQNPVQTSSEHLFCEEELLEWMTRSSLCPVTKAELDPSSITKPGRVILNMLAELELYCSNKPNGCKWIGQNEHLANHLKTCSHKSSEELNKVIDVKNLEISTLHERIESLEMRTDELVEENDLLRSQLSECEKKLRIYNAFLQSESEKVDHNESSSGRSSSNRPQQQEQKDHKEEDEGPGMHSARYMNNMTGISDMDRLARLRTLHSLPQQEPATHRSNRDSQHSSNNSPKGAVHSKHK